MLIGYARVSTDDQTLDLQLDALKHAGCPEHKTYTNQDIARIEHWLNTMPRKILGYHTAAEVMEEYKEEALRA